LNSDLSSARRQAEEALALRANERVFGSMDHLCIVIERLLAATREQEAALERAAAYAKEKMDERDKAKAQANTLAHDLAEERRRREEAERLIAGLAEQPCGLLAGGHFKPTVNCANTNPRHPVGSCGPCRARAYFATRTPAHLRSVARARTKCACRRGDGPGMHDDGCPVTLPPGVA
jgi:hypothetical protein